jgi:hypothetical protein
MSFHGFEKKIIFSLKIHRCYPTVLAKITSLQKKLTETSYFLVVTPYSVLIIHNGLIYKSLRVFKIFKFLLRIHSC